jgi:hypothetical protein
VESRRPRERRVTRHEGRALRLRRSYTVCSTCQVRFFPLDEELALRPGQLPTRLQESLVPLGTWMRFGQTAEALAFFTGVSVSELTVLRTTKSAGVAYETVQAAVVETIEQTLPSVPTGRPSSCSAWTALWYPWCISNGRRSGRWPRGQSASQCAREASV